MPDYSKAVIYEITTGTDIYIGSTCNYTRRKCKHKCRIEFKDTEKNCISKLYNKIRENNNEWHMRPIKEFPCESKLQLTIEEEKNRIEFNATLNSYQCQGQNPECSKKAKKKYAEVHHDRKLESQRRYREKNKERLKEANRIQYI